MNERVRQFPGSLAEIDVWALQSSVSRDEARLRFAQFVVIASLFEAREVSGLLVFKGGNALRFCYESPRSTVDLDFTSKSTFPEDSQRVRSLFDGAVRRGARRFGLVAKVQRVRRNPPSGAATMPTYELTVGYQFPGDRQFAAFLHADVSSPRVVKVEVSVNDLVCEATEHRLIDGESWTVSVCTIEDIVAEKLRALLQQPIRQRTRPQDVYDIARLVRSGDPLDVMKIRRFVIEKCAIRGIVPLAASFDEDVRERARYDAIQLALGEGDTIIDFEVAWETVLGLVRALGLD